MEKCRMASNGGCLPQNNFQESGFMKQGIKLCMKNTCEIPSMIN